MDHLAKTRFVTREVAEAALSALGKIADPKAVVFLQFYYRGAPSETGNALVLAGNRLLSSGDKAGAKDVFGKLYLAGTTAQSGADSAAAKLPAAPIQVRSAALIGWAAADPDSVRPVIGAALQQSQPELQFAAVSAATVAYGEAGVTDALVPLLSILSPTAKTYVLRVLSASAEKEVIAAAGDPDEQVRLAALERLGQIGSAASIPVLFQAATTGSGGAQKAAAAALARMPDPGADAAIAKLAEQGEPKSRAVAISALARRNDQAASPALLKYAGDSDPEVSAAACAALAKLGTDNELEGLIRLVLAGKTPGAAAALQAVATRAHDKSAAAQKLIALTQTAAPQQLAPLFDILALLGGNEAMAALSKAAGGSNEEAKDAAIRALANWPDFPATQPLLVIASDPNAKRVHSVLAVQAVARLVKSSDKEPAAARLKAALAAMNAATRDEEKKLLLSALASVPDRTAGEALKPFLGVPNYQQEAGLAAVTLAEALRKTDKPAAKDLAQAVKSAGISDAITRRADAILKKN
jgi:HEAT repeat protein